MHLRRVMTTLVLSTLLLSACSADPATPEGLPTPTPAPTGAESAESDGPVAEPEPETAKEFIRRWPVVETAMINSGETEDYRAMTDGCQACAALADQVQGFYANGGYAKTDGWEVFSVRSVKKSQGTQFKVTILATPTRFKRTGSSRVERLEGGPRRYFVTVRANKDGWILDDLMDLGR
jgi:hypothetical protein